MKFFFAATRRCLGTTAGTWLSLLHSTVCISPKGFRSTVIFARTASVGAENGPYKGFGSHRLHPLGFQHVYTFATARFRTQRILFY